MLEFAFPREDVIDYKEGERLGMVCDKKGKVGTFIWDGVLVNGNGGNG